jgi:DNA-binding transcriptional regulator YbjK
MYTRPVPETRRRTQSERRAEAEQRLLEAAMRLVAGGGLRAVTLAAVGAEATTSAPVRRSSTRSPAPSSAASRRST